MDCRTGEIVQKTEDIEDSKLVPIEERDLEVIKDMTPFARKNWMRNKPCICKSGKKFKRCCWNKYS